MRTGLLLALSLIVVGCDRPRPAIAPPADPALFRAADLSETALRARFAALRPVIEDCAGMTFKEPPVIETITQRDLADILEEEAVLFSSAYTLEVPLKQQRQQARQLADTQARALVGKSPGSYRFRVRSEELAYGGKSLDVTIEAGKTTKITIATKR